MRKILLTVFLSTLTLSIASCSGENQSEITKQTSQPNNSNVSKNTSDNNQETEDKKESEIDDTAANRDVLPGLIAPTDPERRRQEISKGRQDPFALIPLKPNRRIITKKEEPPTSTVDDKKTIDDKTDQPADTKAVQLAEEVFVSGIVRVSGRTQVILKAPNERFTRHVSLGEYVSDGEVLVKAVKLDSNPPIVVLEQSGIEVLKQIGQS